MGAQLSGDFAKLRRLTEGLTKMAKSRFRLEVNRQLAEEGLSQAQQSFATSTSPYGERWAKPKHRDGQPLLDTGRLRNSLRARADSEGFTISSNVVYAGVHQYGGSIRMKARTSAHDADSGRYLRKALRDTNRWEHQLQGGRWTRNQAKSVNLIDKSIRGARAVRVSRTGAYTFNMPRRQYLPDAPNLGPRWTAGMTNVLTTIRRATLGM